MPGWLWIIVVAAVVVAFVAVLVVWLMNRRRRRERLEGRFGPEYERTVSQADGRRAAESELERRLEKRERLDIVPLSREACDRYSNEWRDVQARFVDEPGRAVGDADRLVTRVMSDRGYPMDDFEQRAADISVDYPDLVDHYRAAHSIYVKNERDEADTEDLRKALVHYRALFRELLEPAETAEEVR